MLEVGGAQVGDLDADIARLPYRDVTEITDEDGDLRGIELRAPLDFPQWTRSGQHSTTRSTSSWSR